MLERLGALETTPDVDFDRIAGLLVDVLDVPAAAVNFVGPERQVFKGCAGMPEPYASTRELPLTWGYCPSAVTLREPLFIADVRTDPTFAQNRAAEVVGVVAYGGVPLIDDGGHALGTVCAMDVVPRDWSMRDRRIMESFAALVVSELLLRLKSEERHRALADSERRFRVLAEAVPVIVWTADAAGWIDWYNHRWYEYTGQTPQEAAGWGWQAAHHPDDFPSVMEAWPHSIATGEPFEMEFRLRRHDGVFHQFLTRIRPLRDDAGEIVRWYGSNIDIQAQQEAFERTQRVAQTLQSVYLPAVLPHTAQVRIDSIYLPAEHDALIGGDWYDAVQLPDGRFLISIGDVAGHGLDASVTAGRLRQTIVALAFENGDPANILNSVNRILRFQEPAVFATAIVGFLDSGCTTWTYAAAGHPAPLLAYTNERPACELPLGGLPLGVQDHLELVCHEVEIRHDAVLALYTDGFTEFDRNVAAAEERLRAAVARLVGDTAVTHPAAAVKEAVLDGAPTSDDAALLIVQFSTVIEDSLRSAPTMLVKEWRFHSSDAWTARTSRHELIDFIRRFADPAASVFEAELILGEILANTVEHAPGLVEIRIDWTSAKPVVTVRDTGPGLRQLGGKLPEDLASEHGRGLFLVNALADDVSVSRVHGFGTELRAVLPLVRR
ncbi:MAG: SpoIIE family protein phosphatase [Candidatus Eremiobacteraeota bacterium]|nr:SpoIIE family protein phosphatase [Candidatus Eremiobacteraeota bacterium]